jgi:hypothetical protein
MADIVVDCHRFTSELGLLLLESPLEMNMRIRFVPAMRLEFDFSATGSNTMRQSTFRYFEQVPYLLHTLNCNPSTVSARGETKRHCCFRLPASEIPVGIRTVLFQKSWSILLGSFKTYSIQYVYVFFKHPTLQYIKIEGQSSRAWTVMEGEYGIFQDAWDWTEMEERDRE